MGDASPGPWVPDLGTAAGRRELQARIAAAPAALLRAEEAETEYGLAAADLLDALPLGRPRLWVAVASPARGVVVRLEHLCRPHVAGALILRKRLAEARFQSPAGDRPEEAAWAWAMLCREHAEHDADTLEDARRARRLAALLRAGRTHR